MRLPLCRVPAIAGFLALTALLALPAAAPLAADGPQEAPLQLSKADANDLARVEHYLNGLTTLRSRFVQVSSRGDSAAGELLLDRPGKARFEYDPPTPVLIIAHGGTVLYHDRELGESSFVPLSSTPLHFLTESDLDLSRDARVLGIERGDSTLAVTLAEKGAESDGRLTLVFSEGPLTLRQWQVVDAEGTTVRVSLIDPAFGVRVSPSQFEFGDLSPYHGSGRRNHGR